MRLKAMVENLLERFSSSTGRTPEANAVLLAVVRCGLGLVLLWRNFFIARDAAFCFDATSWLRMEANWVALGACAHVVLAAMLALGLATRIVSLVLFLSILPFALGTGTCNLGPQFMMPMFAGIFLLRGGAVWSADAALRRFLGKQDPVELPSIRAWQSVGLMLFLFGGALHFTAVQFHLLDADWLGGNTVELMLTNSYLGRHYRWFRAWEAVAPGTLHALSVLGGLLQTIFQLGMIPLVFFRWGRFFVIVHGAIFAVTSMIFLQISILPWVETLLWIWLFLPPAWLPTTWIENTMRRVRNVSIEPYPLVTRAFVLVYSMAIVICITNTLLASYTKWRLPGWLAYGVVNRMGLQVPNVFNRIDLGMGDHWPMIYREADGKKELLPLNGADGEKLDWHVSDLLYYAHSLRWRRGLLTVNDVSKFHDPDSLGYQTIARVIRYDYRRNRLKNETTYTVVVYGNEASRISCAPPERYSPQLVYQFSLVVNRDEIRRLEPR